MKNFYKLIFFTIATSFLTAQTTTNFSTAEGYADGLLSNNTNWGGQYIYVNTTNESVSTQSNTADAFWGQSQSITEGETITFEVDMKFGGDLGYTVNTFIAQIGFNAGGTTSSGGSDRQFIYLKALTNGKLKIERRAGGNLQSTPGYVEGWTIDTWKNEDLTVKVSFELGNSASTSTVTVKLINRTTGDFTDAAFDQNGVFSTSVYNGAVSGNLYGFFRTVTLQDGDGATTESFSVSRVKLVNEDTLFPDTFTNTSGDNQWSTAANWASGSVPTSYTDVTISSGQAIEAVSLATSATLTLSSDASLYQDGVLTNDGQVILNSGSAYKTSANVNGSGTFVYNQNLATTNWYIISSPIAGQDIDAFITAEPIATGSGNNMGLSTYNTATKNWTYIQSGASSSGNFIRGKGYAVKLSSAEAIAIAGSNPTISDVDFTLNYNADSDGKRYNLLGNPFPSYLNTESFLGGNTSKLQTETIWVWEGDGVDDAYTTYVTAQSRKIAPVQGFFVNAVASGSGDVSFLESYQFTSGNPFQGPQIDKSEVKLLISNGSNRRSTIIFYAAGTTTGFDNGWDGEIFGGQNNDFAIYTRFINDTNPELDLAVQSLPDTSYEVPVGVNAISGSEITISATSLDLPIDINVYLEDRENDTLTLLDDTSDYTISLPDGSDGIGRFYLHTVSNELEIGENNLDNIIVYKSNENNLRIVGVQDGMANLKIYNMLGKQILETSFEGNGINNISMQSFQQGIYIVQLETETGILNKKIIL